ncbi:MAG: hypothetical protein Q9220_004118 [cf. Caloplaca sp. 1 TL-2023]
MNAPETPSKADDEIRRITLDLSAKWGLKFPLAALQSPAKRDQGRPEEKVLSRLQFLYFYDKNHNQAATKYAIDCFERLAPKLLAGWIGKPDADEDVLPIRTRSEAARRQIFLTRTPVLSEEQASDLMLALLRYMDEAIEGTRKNAIFSPYETSGRDSYGAGRANHTPTYRDRQPVRRSPRTFSGKPIDKQSSPHKDGNIKRYFQRQPDELLPLPRSNQSAGLELPLNNTELEDESFKDVEMQDALEEIDLSKSSAKRYATEVAMQSPESKESLEDFYQTPPDSPSKMSEKTKTAYPSEDLVPPVKFPFQAHEYGSLKDSPLVQSRKRSLPPPQKPEMPRKLSRDTASRRSAAGVVDQPPGQAGLFNAFGTRGANHGHNRLHDPLHKSFSTESFASVGSSAFTNATSTWTSPNASFRTETPATSFDSSTEPFELEGHRDRSIHTRQSWQNLKEPFGLGLDVGANLVDYDTTEAVSMGPPTLLLPVNSRVSSVAIKNLSFDSPFRSASLKSGISTSLPLAYELCRVSIRAGLPAGSFDGLIGHQMSDYNELWSAIATIITKHRLEIPEKSSLAAWKRSHHDFKGVAMGGCLTFAEESSNRVFDFVLNPLHLEPTYRLARKFGHDRFFVLSIPDLELRQLPSHLRSDPDARKAIIHWLFRSEHCFLGRKWRAIYIKPESNRRRVAGSHDRPHGSRYRVYLFAVSGSDAGPSGFSGGRDPKSFNHPILTPKELVEWFMPMRENRNQKALKFFARLAIGFSQTIPSVQFQPHQIIRSDDARADAPFIRRLDIERSDEKKAQKRLVNSTVPIMNDGCARISKAAAKAISERLGLDRVPSIFQGRIAGAKGVWMVDVMDETLAGLQGDTWIEITDSQLKFEASAGDALYPDPERVTFEVHSYPRPLSSASLNFQLMPILAERKVPFRVFHELLEADLSNKVADLEVAMESGLAIRKWNQEVNFTTTDRSVNGVEWHGGLPASLSEKINWFAEHGFEPSSCCRLKDLLYLAIAGYCLRLENRMNIGVAKSTYAFMIADPLAILEQGEVHLGFSKPFDQELVLHHVNLLVARLPAALPSDIQKNAAYHDVPSLEAYGIETDAKTVGNCLDRKDYVDDFLQYAFDFNLQSNFLGICTSYFESLCYSKNDISHPCVMKVAQLLGHLVDRAKSGIIFDNEKWNAFLASEGLPRHLPKPAYKDKERGIPKRDNLIDHLIFKVAKGVREKVLGDFSRRFRDVGTYDNDLVRIYKAEFEEARNDKGIAQALKDIKSGLQEIKDYWALHSMRGDDLKNEEAPTPIRGRRKSVIPLQLVTDRVREDFLALGPSEEAVKFSPIVARWDRERASASTRATQPHHWTLLKASTAFSLFHNTSFIWYCCGIELGIMKAQSKGCRNVVDPIWECMKVNGKMVRRRLDGESRDDGYPGGGGVLMDRERNDEGEDEYGDWGWVEGID